MRVDPKDTVVKFLETVALIGKFRDSRNLDEWEKAVLNVYTDKEWDEFEQRDDFDVIESVWEVGRFNLFGAINEKGTRNFYQQTAERVKNHTGLVVLEPDHFDFSEW